MEICDPTPSGRLPLMVLAKVSPRQLCVRGGKGKYSIQIQIQIQLCVRGGKGKYSIQIQIQIQIQLCVLRRRKGFLSQARANTHLLSPTPLCIYFHDRGSNKVSSPPSSEIQIFVSIRDPFKQTEEENAA